MATIQKRLGKTGVTTYRVGYRHDGKLRWTHAVDDPEVAVEFKELFEKVGPEIALATIKARIGRTTDDGPPLLSAWLETHLTNISAHVTSFTVADYRRMAARTWLTRLGALPVDKITRDHIAEWIAWQRKQETRISRLRRAKAEKEGRDEIPPVEYCSAKSIANAHGLLSSVLDAAAERSIIPRNVARGMKLPSDGEGHEMVFLTDAEFAKLLAKIPPAHQPFVALLAGTGCRWGEATALRAADFMLDGDQPSVRITRAWKRGDGGRYLGTTKTTRGVRTVTIPTSLADMLRPVVANASGEQLVFRNRAGSKIDHSEWSRVVWKRAVPAAGIGKEPRIHDLRHSHASWLIAAGVPLPVIQRRLGHESIKTTVDRYGHLSPDAHWGAAEAAGAALAGALPQIEA